MPEPVREVAPDVFRICTYVADFDLQFNQFLVRDDEPLLYHTGMNALFPAVKEAVASLIDPSRLRWIAFSHFEADECGSMNRWLEIAPHAQVACGAICSAINVGDAIVRPARVLQDGETLTTGRKRFRYDHTPQLPHGWDAGMLFEETTRSLFCSDLLHQLGDVEPLTRDADVLGRFRHTLTTYNASPFANYMPYTEASGAYLDRLARLGPGTLLPMHGSSYAGDGARVLRGVREALSELAVAAPARSG